MDHLGVEAYSRVLFCCIDYLGLEVDLALDFVFGDEVKKLLVEEAFLDVEIFGHF